MFKFLFPKKKPNLPLTVQSNFNTLANLFNYPSFNTSFLQYLSTKHGKTQQVCAKELDKQGAWKCLDCEKDSTCIICNECYINGKDKHIGHNLQYNPSVSGCCDCGNPEAWDPKGFCSLHKGTFTTDKEVHDYIYECFSSETLISKIEKQLYITISQVAEWVNGQQREKGELEKDANGEFIEFIEMMLNLCKVNIGMVHILSKVLIKKTLNSIYTQHKCFYLNEKNEIHITQTSSSEHKCNCNLLALLLRNITTQEIAESLLFYFLQDFNLKRYIGLLYFSMLPSEVHQSKVITNFGVQVLRNQVGCVISTKKEYIDLFFNGFYETCKLYIESKPMKLNALQQLVGTVLNGLLLLSGNEVFVEMVTQRFIIYKRVIDIIMLVHYKISFDEERMFIKDGFEVKFVEVEIDLLSIFHYVVSLKSFDSSCEKNNYDILNYLMQQIKNKHMHKINKSEFSSHIPLYRALAIYLTRFAFAMCLNENKDFRESLLVILKTIPKYEGVFANVFDNIMRSIGFIKSTELDFWKFCGSGMSNYNYGYVHVRLFHLCDFALLNIILGLSIPEVNSSLIHILQMGSIKNSYSLFEQLMQVNFDFNSLHPNVNTHHEFKIASNGLICIQNEEEISIRNFNLSSKILEFYLKIIRNSSSLWHLLILQYYLFTQFKIRDPVISLLKEREYDSIIESTKQQIIINLLINGNIASYAELDAFTYPQVKDFIGDDKMKEIYNEIAIGKEGKVFSFSAKDSLLSLYDSCMIIISSNESKAQQYIMDFKSKEINIINVADCSHIKCLESLYTNCINQLCSKDNIELLSHFICGILSSADTQSKYTHIFLNVVAKYLNFISTIINNCSQENIDAFLSELPDMLSIVDATESSDPSVGNVCAFLKEQLAKAGNIRIIKNSNEEDTDKSGESALKTKKKAMIDKYKKKFKKHNNSVTNKFANDIKVSSNEKEVQCVVCKCAIDEQNELNGKFGYIINDYFVYNMLYKTSQEIYEQCIHDNKFDIQYKNDFNKVKSFRLYSCNHVIHFSCYEKLLLNNLNRGFSSVLRCPLCQIMTNVFIPHLYHSASLQQTDKSIAAMYFIEQIFKEAFETQVLITDLQNEEEGSDSINYLLKGFNDYLIFLTSDKCGDDSFKVSQIKLVSFVIQAFRVLIKEGFLKEELFTSIMNKKISDIENGNIVKDVLLYKEKDSLIGEILFMKLILGLIDNKEENNIIKECYPYIAVVQYLRKLYFDYRGNLNEEECLQKLTFEECIQYYCGLYDNSNNNKENEYQNSLTKKYISKMFKFITIAQQISSLLNDNTLYEKPEISISSQNDNSLYKDFLSSLSNDSKSIIENIFSIMLLKIKTTTLIPLNILLMSAISCSKFSLITLPQNVQLLFEKIAGNPCAICNKHSNPYFICLICGKQICFDEACKVLLNGSLKRNIFYHIEECSGGNGIVAFSDSNKVLIINEHLFSKTGCSMYRNKFGEFAKERSISNEYTLSENDYDKAMELYVTRVTLTNDLVMKND